MIHLNPYKIRKMVFEYGNVSGLIEKKCREANLQLIIGLCGI